MDHFTNYYIMDGGLSSLHLTNKINHMKNLKYNKSTKTFGVSEDNYAFLMAYFRMPLIINAIQDDIKPLDIYDKPGYGYELEPHVTIYPCMDNDADIEMIKRNLIPHRSIKAYLTNVSKFENDDYDVLKCDIISDHLCSMNAIFATNFVSHSEYKEYHPHMTIAYVEKGTCDNLLREFKTPIELVPIGYVFSYYDGNENKKLTWKI